MWRFGPTNVCVYDPEHVLYHISIVGLYSSLSLFLSLSLSSSICQPLQSYSPISGSLNRPRSTICKLGQPIFSASRLWAEISCPADMRCACVLSCRCSILQSIHDTLFCVQIARLVYDRKLRHRCSPLPCWCPSSRDRSISEAVFLSTLKQ